MLRVYFVTRCDNLTSEMDEVIQNPFPHFYFFQSHFWLFIFHFVMTPPAFINDALMVLFSLSLSLLFFIFFSNSLPRWFPPCPFFSLYLSPPIVLSPTNYIPLYPYFFLPIFILSLIHFFAFCQCYSYSPSLCISSTSSSFYLQIALLFIHSHYFLVSFISIFLLFFYFFLFNSSLLLQNSHSEQNKRFFFIRFEFA